MCLMHSFKNINDIGLLISKTNKDIYNLNINLLNPKQYNLPT